MNLINKSHLVCEINGNLAISQSVSQSIFMIDCKNKLRQVFLRKKSRKGILVCPFCKNEIFELNRKLDGKFCQSVVNRGKVTSLKILG